MSKQLTNNQILLNEYIKKGVSIDLSSFIEENELNHAG